MLGVARHAIAAALLAVLALIVPAAAADHPLRGVALVIGQSKYDELPVLANPSKDARDIDRLLGDLGFEVDRVLNADGDELREAIARFTEDAKGADVALVYYSGHGIEAKGENYLAPTDTDLSSPQTAGDSLVPVQPMLEALSKVAPVTIVLLDACRSDPFPAGQLIVLPGDTQPVPIETQGLAAVRGPTPLAKPDADPNSLGTVIGFAAEPGEPALDGAPGENSPYAAALLKHLSAGGYSFGDVMTMVTEEVYLKTKAKQLPWTNSSLRRVLTFAAPEEASEDQDQVAIKTERRKLLLSIAGTPAQTRTYVETLAGAEAVPLDALYGMLGVLGIKVSDGGADLEQQLQKGAERLKELMAEKSTAVKADPELERLSRLADDAEEEGAIALALKYRDEASGRADTLLAGKQAEADKLRQDMADIARTYADNAATALLNFDHRHAAELYGKAFEAVKDWDTAAALDYKIKQGDALTDHGYYTTDNDAVTAALDAYNQALALAPKATDPAGWAKVQSRIGAAQQTVGTRLADGAMLRASVESYHAALTVQTEAGASIEWAKTQNNLGNTLFTLGSRARDLDTLKQAVAALDASMRVITQASDPAGWGRVQSNRSSAQVAIADLIYASTGAAEMAAYQAGNADASNIPEVKQARDQAIAVLTEAVDAFSAVLSTKGSVAAGSLDWAMTQHGLATALSERGKMANSADDLKAAADAYREVLTVHTRERTPVQWATTAANLASTLRQYAKQVKQPEPLREAVQLLTQVIELTPRDAAPLDWADMQTKLGNVFVDLADYDGPANLDAGIAAYRAASEVVTPERDIAGWDNLQVYITTALFSQAATTLDLAKLEEARQVAQAAQDRIRSVGYSDTFYDSFLPQVATLADMLATLKAAK